MEMTGGAEQIFLATVKEVNEDEFTCTVEVNADIKYIDVRLRSIIDPDKKGFCFIPKIESLVQVGRIGNSNELYVAMFSEVDKVLLFSGSLELTIDQDKVELKKGDKISLLIKDDQVLITADQSTLKQTAAGFTMTRGGEGLKKILTDLISTINQLTVPTGVGPSGPPINLAAFTAISTRLNNFLEG
jgi:hypothetical protein